MLRRAQVSSGAAAAAEGLEEELDALRRLSAAANREIALRQGCDTTTPLGHVALVPLLLLLLLLLLVPVLLSCSCKAQPPLVLVRSAAALRKTIRRCPANPRPPRRQRGPSPTPASTISAADAVAHLQEGLSALGLADDGDVMRHGPAVHETLSCESNDTVFSWLLSFIVVRGRQGVGEG